MKPNKAVNYIREAIDSVFGGEENKKKRKTATDEINEFLDGMEKDKLPERPVLPDAPSFDRMEYDAPTNESIRDRAESELTDYRQNAVNGIEKEIAELDKKYNADIAAAKEQADSAANKTSAAYAEAKQNTDNDMLRRGIARSSIAANKKAALESGEAAAKAELYEEYGRQANELSQKISELSVKREQALNDFNLAYAAKLSDRINELYDERDKKVNEALKYNNSLAEKEHNAAVDKQMKESDLYSEALSQREKENNLGANSESGESEAYAFIAQKLREMNGADARDTVLNNPRIRAAVGNTYFYYKLYDEFCR